MPKTKAPRSGSMQFWPRKRASRPHARLRSFSDAQGILAVAGYKAGMTHVKAFDTDKNSVTKNEQLSIPVTVIECPPLQVFAVRGYKRTQKGLRSKEQAIVGKHKHLEAPAPVSSIPDSLSSCDEIRIVLMTQPDKTGIGQKKPQLFEAALGGKNAEEQLATAKELVGKEIRASEIFKEGDYVDAHAITTGRGTQGPVKRFGIGLKAHKSEKGRRRPGSLGGWSGQQHFMYRVPMAGQTGYQQRVQYNNMVLKITDAQEVNPAGGFPHYGTVREGNDVILVRGSVPGPKKRLITLAKPIRLKKTRQAPTIDAVSTRSKQGK